MNLLGLYTSDFLFRLYVSFTPGSRRWHALSSYAMAVSRRLVLRMVQAPPFAAPALFHDHTPLQFCWSGLGAILDAPPPEQREKKSVFIIVDFLLVCFEYASNLAMNVFCGEILSNDVHEQVFLQLSLFSEGVYGIMHISSCYYTCYCWCCWWRLLYCGPLERSCDRWAGGRLNSSLFGWLDWLLCAFFSRSCFLVQYCDIRRA